MRTILTILSFVFINNIFGQLSFDDDILFSQSGDTILIKTISRDSNNVMCKRLKICARSNTTDTLVILSKWLVYNSDSISNDTIIKYGLINKGKTIDALKIKDFRIELKEKQTKKIKNDENLQMTSCEIAVSLYYKERLVSKMRNLKAYYFGDKIKDPVTLYGWKMDNKEKYVIMFRFINVSHLPGDKNYTINDVGKWLIL